MEVEHTMVRTEDEHARNLLHTVVLNVENEYESYRFHQTALLNERKAEVKHISGIALRQIEGFYNQYYPDESRRTFRFHPKTISQCNPVSGGTRRSISNLRVIPLPLRPL
jgi:hypothetical protein